MGRLLGDVVGGVGEGATLMVGATVGGAVDGAWLREGAELNEGGLEGTELG